MAVDLSITSLGMRLAKPLVVASRPHGGEVYRRQQLKPASAAEQSRSLGNTRKMLTLRMTVMLDIPCN